MTSEFLVQALDFTFLIAISSPGGLKITPGLVCFIPTALEVITPLTRSLLVTGTATGSSLTQPRCTGRRSGLVCAQFERLLVDAL